MTTELRIIRLPPRLSDLVDEAVGLFVEQHANERLQAHRRYHDADLWMIFRHEPVGETDPAFLTRRVTVATYSDDSERVRFIPDIVVTRPAGRFMLQPNGWQQYIPHQLPPISTLQVRLSLEPERTATQLMDGHEPGSIARALEDAWQAAKRLEPREATQLIP